MKYSLLILLVCQMFMGLNAYAEAKKKTQEVKREELRIIRIPQGPILRSVIFYPELAVSKFGDRITFSADVSVGLTKVSVVDASGQTVLETVYEITAGTVYVLDISVLSAGVYKLNYFMPEYYGLEYAGEWTEPSVEQ